MSRTFLFLVVVSLTVLSTAGCSRNEPEPDASKLPPEGYELKISCRGGVPGGIYVKVLSEERVEDFGITGAGPNGRDGGKTTMWSPIVLGKDVVVCWGVEGQDGLQRKHRATFDTRKLAPMKKQVKALELRFSGGEAWELRAYDDSTASDQKKLLMTLQPNK